MGAFTEKDPQKKDGGEVTKMSICQPSARIGKLLKMVLLSPGKKK